VRNVEEYRSKTNMVDRCDDGRNRRVPVLGYNTHATSRGALSVRYAVENGRFLSIVTKYVEAVGPSIVRAAKIELQSAAISLFFLRSHPAC